MQNKLLLNQSSVSLEIEGLPDLSNDEKKRSYIYNFTMEINHN